MKIIRYLVIAAIIATIGYIIYSLIRSSIRLDEAQTIWIALRPLQDILKLSVTMSHGPLYYVVLHYWIALFGVSLVSIRTLSFILYIATLFVLYGLVRELGGKRLAFATIALFSLSPLIFLYSFEAGIYMMLVLIATINHKYFFHVYRSYGRKGKLGYILSFIAGFYTHYFFILLFLSQFIFLIYKTISRNRKDSKRTFVDPKKQELKIGQGTRYLQIFLTSLILALPLLLYVIYKGDLGGPSTPIPNSYNFAQIFFNFLFGYQNNLYQTFFISFWPLLGILIFFAFARGKRIPIKNIDYFILVTLIPLILIFGISFLIPINFSRYLVFLAPSLFILFSLSLLRGSEAFSFSLVIVALLLMFVFLISQTVSFSNPSNENYKGASKYLTDNVSPVDIVVVSPPFTVYPIQYYYNGSATVMTLPEWNYLTGGNIPTYSKDKVIGEINSLKATYSRLYYISSENDTQSKEIKDYLDRNYLALEKKKFSSNIEMTVYKLRYEGIK